LHRTLVERDVYAFGQHAVSYLEARRKKRLDEYMSEVGVRPGIAQKDFKRRLMGEGLNRIRGPRKPCELTQGLERLDLDDLSPLFDAA
jgi:hypothetical protein